MIKMGKFGPVVVTRLKFSSCNRSVNFYPLFVRAGCCYGTMGLRVRFLQVLVFFSGSFYLAPYSKIPDRSLANLESKIFKNYGVRKSKNVSSLSLQFKELIFNV